MMSEPPSRNDAAPAAANPDEPAPPAMPVAASGDGLVLTEEELERGDRLLVRLVDFAHFLYELGVDIGPGRVVEAVECLPLVDIGDRGEFRTLLRVLFVSRREQEPVFDLAFDYFWRSSRDAQDASALAEELARQTGAKVLALPRHRERPGEQPGEAQRMVTHGTPERHPARRLLSRRQRDRTVDDEDADHFGTYSYEEILRRKDFEDFTHAEMQDARELLSRMRWRLGLRRTRRLRRSSHGRRLDLRATLRRSLRNAGEPVALMRRAPREKPRPLVILCDISGSMSLYSRLLLHFVHTVSNGRENVEAFVFATRLTRITRQLARRDVEAAIRSVTRSVSDWSGGTRIGGSLRAFNRTWSRRVLGHGAVALIISDGWDRGDVSVLAEEMARLRRNCHRLIWLNPLLGQEDYRPVTSGMRAALPYVDDFLPANNLDSLIALGQLLEAIDDRPRGAPRVVPRVVPRNGWHAAAQPR